MLTLFDYANELLDLNKEPLQTWDKQRFYSSVAFGLVEELLEFNEADHEFYNISPTLRTDKRLLKEAGDVLAYVVLVLAAQELTPDQMVLEYNKYLDSFTSPLAAASAMAGLFKRHFRENQSVPVASVFFCLNTVLSELSPHGITLADIAEANLKKLKDRANRGLLFQGTGSDR